MADTSKKSTGAKKSSGTRSSSAKSSSSKKTAAKKPASKKNAKNGAQITLEEFISSREFKTGLVFVLGLVLLIITVFAGSDGSVWNTVHSFYFAIFGVSGFYIPAAVIFLGIVSVLNRLKSSHGIKTAEIFILFLIICSLLHVNKFITSDETGYFDAVKNVYDLAMRFSLNPISSGGVLGALLGGALFQLGKSKIIANIILVILLIADLMLLFGITLFKLFTGIEKPVKKAGEYTGQALETAKTDIERRRKENEEQRARRRNERAAALEATRVVNDFYTDGTKEAENKTQAASSQPEADIASIFERVEKRYSPPPAEKTAPDKPAASLFDEAPAEKEPEAEKPSPLTAEETRALNSELDTALEKPVHYEYIHPPLECLKMPKNSDRNYDINELKANGEKLIAALNSFNVSATISDVIPGPTVTRYELSPAPGVKISKFVGLSDDLALHMAAPAGLRIEAPIPNKAAIGIEIPNRSKTTVSFREVIDTDDFRNAKSKLNAALGKDIAGDVIYTDIAKMPHLLVAGTTGSGKSVCMNTMIVSLLYNAGPDEVKILLIDPKQVEFGVYNGIPHLLVPVVSDPRKASGALAWAVTEMLTRYKTLNANGVRDIASYNSLCEGNDELEKMAQIVIFIDELADLMTVAPAEVEDSIQRIAQMGRAAGMHLVIATQRPSVDVITGVIKANIPSRIALTVKSQIDSRTIIDQAGAEKLMGYGDMLYYPVGIPKPVRVQGAFLTTGEIENIVSFLKANGESQYDDNIQQEIERQAASDKKKGASSDEKASDGLDKGDDLLMRAIDLFVSAPEKASISALQRHLGLGFAKAGRLMDTLEEKGVVGPTEGSKPRKVLITKAQWYEMNAMSSEVTNAGSDNTDYEDISATSPADFN
ncbi:MAG: DNA translocase FtsK [Clostridia bacterium]|nr:DNA translocase FtsK [Clostridia bacterium]